MQLLRESEIARNEKFISYLNSEVTKKQFAQDIERFE